MVHAADTRPCPIVVEHARGAGLLVHEAYGLEDAKRAHAFGGPVTVPSDLDAFAF